ncbi:conserved hypothetical protein [Coccidioides posadasii str. Silveira]|uniref:Uncharacterized protein n=1 Tax=Coccidioides posadasii (strain RMSCC 757 / Silveira) TaxID=443226 RepID=E9D751_COCPS|nr:conserved hypothetical protein [Coccidioides posadasii str. Silveira]
MHLITPPLLSPSTTCMLPPPACCHHLHAAPTLLTTAAAAPPPPPPFITISLSLPSTIRVSIHQMIDIRVPVWFTKPVLEKQKEKKKKKKKKKKNSCLFADFGYYLTLPYKFDMMGPGILVLFQSHYGSGWNGK